MKDNNYAVLARLEQAHRAVQALSEQGFTVQFVDMGACQPRLTVTRGRRVPGLRTSQVIGAGVCFGCEVVLVRVAAEERTPQGNRW